MTKHLHWLFFIKQIVHSVYNIFILLILLQIPAIKISGNLKLFGFIFLTILILCYFFLNYWMQTYTITKDEFILKSGVFVKNINHVPYTKIQSIKKEQPFYLQIFNLSNIIITTSSTSDGSIQLPFINESTINLIEQNRKSHQSDIKSIILYPKQNSADQKTTIEQTDMAKNGYKISTQDLFLLAITTVKFGPSFILLCFLSQFVPKFLPHRFLDMPFLDLLNITYIILFIIFILLFVSITNIIQSINSYYNHTVILNKDTLTVSRGFLTTKTINLHENNINAVILKQSLLLRFFKLYSVELILSSGGGDYKIDKSQLEPTLLIPIIHERNIKTTLKDLCPKYDFSTFNKTTPNNNNFGRFLRFNTLYSLFFLPILVCLVYFKFYVFVIIFAIVILILLVLATIIANHDTGYQVMDKQIVIQNTRLFTKQINLIRVNKIQSIQISQSIFMVKNNISHFNVLIRDDLISKEVHLRYLDLKKSNKLTNWYKSNA